MISRLGLGGERAADKASNSDVIAHFEAPIASNRLNIHGGGKALSIMWRNARPATRD
jgi:hypothetical protein